jgi:integral membrane protein
VPELRRYRIMATIVGCFVIAVFALFFAQLATGPTSWFNRHEEQIGFFDMVHGFLYMGFLVVAALLARSQRWSLLFTATTLIAGTVPILSFWAEHRATAAVRAAQSAAAPVR